MSSRVAIGLSKVTLFWCSIDGALHPAFDNCVDAVDCNSCCFFFHPAGPMDFNFANLSRRSKSKMDALIGTGSVAAAAQNISPLPHSTHSQEHFCANCIARTLWSTNQLKRYPMIAVLDDVAQ